ncbi:ABC transporter substrate-binding protein [Bacillota bacterium LX-D]|nr:ABC transporter substrate-binding protein [Bacillota bacterium LX-D]
MKKNNIMIVALLLVLTLVLSACGSKATENGIKQTEGTNSGQQRQNQELVKVTLGTYNGTCEAPLYVGVENGIFKKYGLDVTLVNINAETLKEGLASGKIDGAQISPGLFKAIEQGMDIKLTNGIHTGCIQGVVAKNSPIQGVKDLKGKKVGIDSIGGVPMVLLSIDLGKAGIDPKKDVDWRVYPQVQLQQALEKGEIDAFVAWDPYGALAISGGKARKIFGNTNKQPGVKDNYCCYTGVSGKLAKEKPEVAKKITAAWAEATQWVQEHPQEAAKIAVDKKYVSSGSEVENSKLLGDYEFLANKAKAKIDFENTLNAMKTQGILDPGTNIKKLVQDTFLD